MGFRRHGQRAETNLTDLDGDLVALRFEGVATNISFDLPEEGNVTRDVVRARLFTFLPDGSRGEYLGETLVFPQVIARDLMDAPADWHLGVLTKRTQRGDSSRTVYTLDAPESADRVYDRMEDEITKAGQA